MIDRLIDLLLQFLDLFRFWEVIDEYERGIVLRYGHYRREIGPGLWFVLPFKIDRVITENIVLKTADLKTQTLTTMDGKSVVISPVVTYSIKDVRKFLLEVERAESVLADSTYGVVAEMVRHSLISEMTHDSWHDDLYKKVRKQAFQFGIEVHRVQCSDFGEMRTIRLIQSNDVVVIE